MAIPVAELIARDIASTLAGVTVSADYENTLTVERPRGAIQMQAQDCLCIVLQGDSTPSEDHPQMFDEWTTIYSVIAFVVESQNSELAIDARLNSIAADILKALTLTSFRRSDLAINTTPVGITFAPAPTNAYTGEVTVDVAVLYRTLRGNPYSQS